MDKTGFIKYLERKDLAQRTQTGCLRYLKMFFEWLGTCDERNRNKEDIQVTKPDILRYLEHLKNKGLQNATRKNHLTSLNHYFTFLYQNEQITDNPCIFLKIRGTKRKIMYKIYTPEELVQLFDNYYHFFVRNYDNSHQRHDLQRHCSALSKERNALILSILINQGLVVTEIGKIELDDIDFIKATIKIRGGKRLDDRTLPLKASQMGLLMHYLQKIRPQLLEYNINDKNKLFLLLSSIGKKNKNNKENELIYIFDRLVEQVKLIDKQFFNFTQIRVSLITYWIKTQGLRKAQYMAGHRNISTTEAYLPNNLDDLINDINKLHPF
jgi:site-specific recombinase XerD